MVTEGDVENVTVKSDTFGPNTPTSFGKKGKKAFCNTVFYS